MENNFESTNVHLDWLKNIFNQIMRVQEFERLAREGCSDLMEYLQIPMEYHNVIIPETMYKNLRFMALELDILIINLSSILKDVKTKEDKSEEYSKRLKPILQNINKRSLFLKSKTINNKLVQIDITDFFYTTMNFLLKIKSELIKDISPLLYLGQDKKKEW